MNHKLALALLTLAPFSSFAEQAKEEKPAFSASAELGALYQTGNTKNTDFKAGLDFRYEKGLWVSTAEFDALIKKSEQPDDNGDQKLTTTANKWSINGKTNYTLDENSKNYVYGNAYYGQDKFSGFANQSSLSAGWGRRLIDTKTSTLDADIGPGFKRDVLEADGTNPQTTQNSFIVQAQGFYTYKFNENVEFKQSLSAKYAPKSDENSIYKSESSITTKLIESLQLRIALTIDHNTNVDPGRKKTDTQTSITAVYNF